MTAKTEFVVIWFDRGSIFSLQDSQGKPVYLSKSEVDEDLDGYIYDQNDADSAFAAANPETRFGITPEALEIFYGIYLD